MPRTDENPSRRSPLVAPGLLPRPAMTESIPVSDGAWTRSPASVKVGGTWQRAQSPSPLNTASPWIEKKISVTLSRRAAAGSRSAAAATEIPL